MNLKHILEDINKETKDVSTFSLEWLKSRLNKKYEHLNLAFSYLIDRGKLIVSHTKKILSKGEYVDEIFYRTDEKNKTNKNG
jgi:disulfide oxidoreductase YuzD